MINSIKPNKHILRNFKYNMFQEIKNLTSNNTERLDWDDYFMSIALLASQRSPCERLQVGSVIVKNNRIISMGYNGYIPGAPHISRVKDNHEQSIIHSEINAITDCAKRGASLENGKIYVTHYPCINCFRSIAACGIKEIMYLNEYKNDPIVNELANDSCIIIKQL
jgi:dCMP deaminase